MKIIAMKLLLFLFVNICLALANRTGILQAKIIGGSRISINQVPFTLSLHAVNRKISCGAVILSSRWGISARHCVTIDSPGMHYVRAGSSKNVAGGSIHKIQKFYPYGNRDIVLFKVRQRFRFSSKVRAARLPPDGIEPPKTLQVSGWGLMNVGDKFVRDVFLRGANVTRFTYEDCIASSPRYPGNVQDKIHLCYGGVNVDACLGDSGGPLADANTVWGIVSFGDGCGKAPGIYVRVSYYNRWIKRIARI